MNGRPSSRGASASFCRNRTHWGHLVTRPGRTVAPATLICNPCSGGRAVRFLGHCAFADAAKERHFTGLLSFARPFFPSSPCVWPSFGRKESAASLPLFQRFYPAMISLRVNRFHPEAISSLQILCLGISQRIAPLDYVQPKLLALRSLDKQVDGGALALTCHRRSASLRVSQGVNRHFPHPESIALSVGIPVESALF